jgi:uncharacterized membrane protein
MADDLPVPENKADSEKADAADFVEIITKQNPRLFNGLDKKKRDQIVNAISIGFMHVQKSHSGPLPDAETLEHYDKIIPNGAERIMSMAEKEQAFRHTYTSSVTKRQLNQISKGQIFGFIIAIVGVGGGIFLAYSGKETSGLSTIIASMVMLVGAFIYGKAQDKKQDKN